MATVNRRQSGPARPVVAARGRPKDPAKRTSILDAAWILFTRDGFDGASMDHIAQAAGVSKATLYSHFADKESLFEGVIRARIERVPAVVPPDLARIEDLRAALEAFGRRLLAILTDPDVHSLHRLLMTHRDRHPRLLAIIHRNGPQRMHEELAGLLSRGHALGHLRVPDPALAADHLLSMWKGMAHVALEMGVAPPRTPAEVRRHVRSCIDVLFRAYARSR